MLVTVNMFVCWVKVILVSSVRMSIFGCLSKRNCWLNVMALWLCLHGGLEGIPGGNIVNTCHVYGVIIWSFLREEMIQIYFNFFLFHLIGN